jgi:hypothetical protein
MANATEKAIIEDVAKYVFPLTRRPADINRRMIAIFDVLKKRLGNSDLSYTMSRMAYGTTRTEALARIGATLF